MLTKKNILLIALVIVACIAFSGCTSTEPTISDIPEQVVVDEVGEIVEEIDIDSAWQNSAHSNTFVTNSDGENSKCAQCHGPINFIPGMDDIPASCFSCKFEVADPPPLIAEEEWENIPCETCHKVEKDEVQPEYVWLEIAAIDEYAEVSSTTELCKKCHIEADAPGHFEVVVEGAHQEYDCTDCHDSHSTVASCGEVGCHESLDEAVKTIAGHDEDHQAIACYVCHDGAGLAFEMENGEWITVIESPDDSELYPFVSHNQVLTVDCERCHFEGNLWGLSEISE